MLVFTVFLLVMVAVALGWTDRVRWRWLVTAGSLTYPLYLMHYAAGTALISRLRDEMDARLLVAVVLAGFPAVELGGAPVRGAAGGGGGEAGAGGGVRAAARRSGGVAGEVFGGDRPLRDGDVLAVDEVLAGRVTGAVGGGVDVGKAPEPVRSKIA